MALLKTSQPLAAGPEGKGLSAAALGVLLSDNNIAESESEWESVLGLEVTDFGPIAEAKVDLRPLTVFIGPSNTGKSYLAILIYALHQIFSSNGRMYWGVSPKGRIPHVSAQDVEKIIDSISDIARSLADDSEKGQGQDSIVLPLPVIGALSSGYDELAHALPAEIGRCFGIDRPSRLIRKGRSKSARVILRCQERDNASETKHTLTLAENSEFKIQLPAQMPIHDDHSRDYLRSSAHRLTSGEIELQGDAYHRVLAAREFLLRIGATMMSSLVRPLHLPAYYLPADRTGIMHAHNVVVNALIARAPMAGITPGTHTPMLSGVLADFLEQLIEINPGQPTHRHALKNQVGDLDKAIETILDGKVRVDRAPYTGYPRFAYIPRGWKKGGDLALANASSMVSELAPVVLYLRHKVRPGNVLIIEEPEAHLHPAKQVEFTRQIARLVAAGIRVVVTTHSEWLLEELANIVRRSELPENKRGGNAALRPNQVGAWLFEPKRRPMGSVVKEIHLDDSGLYPSGFSEVASALHNEWADISSQIENGS